jgi:two-component system KDP operon response regulator KdpE
MHILIVEDEPVNRILLRAVLSKSTEPRLRQASIAEAETLEAGRTALAADRFDVLILDVRLHDGDGLDLARELSSEPGSSESRPRPKILVMSASVLQADRDEAIRAGADEFLAKPFLPADLTAVLVRLVPADGPEGVSPP